MNSMTTTARPGLRQRQFEVTVVASMDSLTHIKIGTATFLRRRPAWRRQTNKVLAERGGPLEEKEKCRLAKASE